MALSAFARNSVTSRY